MGSPVTPGIYYMDWKVGTRFPLQHNHHTSTTSTNTTSTNTTSTNTTTTSTTLTTTTRCSRSKVARPVLGRPFSTETNFSKTYDGPGEDCDLTTPL